MPGRLLVLRPPTKLEACLSTRHSPHLTPPLPEVSLNNKTPQTGRWQLRHFIQTSFKPHLNLVGTSFEPRSILTSILNSTLTQTSLKPHSIVIAYNAYNRSGTLGLTYTLHHQPSKVGHINPST